MLTSDSESREEIQVVASTTNSSEKRGDTTGGNNAEQDISSSVNFDMYNDEDISDVERYNNDDLYTDSEKISILGHKRVKILKQRQTRPSLPPPPTGDGPLPEQHQSMQLSPQLPLPPPTQPLQQLQQPQPLPPPLQATTSNGEDESHHHHPQQPPPQHQQQQPQHHQPQRQFSHDHERHSSIVKQEIPSHPDRDREDRDHPYYPYSRMDGHLHMPDHRSFVNVDKPIKGSRGSGSDMYGGLTTNYRISSALSPTSATHRGGDPHELKVVSTYSVRRNSASPHDTSNMYENVPLKKTFFCYLCGKEYRSGTGLKQHLLAHKNEKPFGCNICQRRYRWKGDLNRHMYTHLPNNELPLKCPQCNKGFVRKDKMQLHINFAHGGTNPPPPASSSAGATGNDESKLSKISNNSSSSNNIVENNVEMNNVYGEESKHSPTPSPTAQLPPSVAS